jgi:TolB-like protein/Tfp pilus assembly protein PilF
MITPTGHSQTLRFGGFELDLRSGELFKYGRKIRLREQPFQILGMLLKHSGEIVTREELRQKLWLADTFVDFDHGLNNAINRLREALGDSADSPRFIETLPRRGYRWIAQVEPGAEASLLIRSVAVLPLENLTGDPSQEYFVDGMTDALIGGLAQIAALRVISRTSAMQYKGARKPLPQIAQELNVDAVVEGSVTRSGGRVRVMAQLIHAQTDRHLWAEKYERELGDILDLQSEVARAIVQELRVQLHSEEMERLATTRPVNPEAYESYLLGQFHWNRRDEEGLEKALDHFQRAIDQDPGSALGYAGVADCHNMLGFWGFRPPSEVYPAARAAATKALGVDETLAEAHAALAWPMFVYAWDWAGAARELKRAVQLNPGYATAHQWWSHYFTYLGRHSEAFAAVKRTLELDPLSPVMNASAAFVYLQGRELDRAAAQAQKCIELDPTHAPAAHLHLGRVYEQRGKFQEAFAEFEKAISLSARSPIMLAALGHAYAVSGKTSEARNLLQELQQLSRQRYVSPDYIAVLYAGLGEREQAFTWLQRAYEEHSAWAVVSKVDSRLDGLRADPRFRKLIRAIGLSS